MSNIQQLTDRITTLEERNKRVETDKAWETSWTRKISIMILTYFIVVSYLAFVVHVDPWINAVVPVVGFFLSTLTISVIKKFWTNSK